MARLGLLNKQAHGGFKLVVQQLTWQDAASGPHEPAAQCCDCQWLSQDTQQLTHRTGLEQAAGHQAGPPSLEVRHQSLILQV
jgi:hypothetical protein